MEKTFTVIKLNGAQQVWINYTFILIVQAFIHVRKCLIGDIETCDRFIIFIGFILVIITSFVVKFLFDPQLAHHPQTRQYLAIYMHLSIFIF